jgi:hypothetical protein
MGLIEFIELIELIEFIEFIGLNGCLLVGGDDSTDNKPLSCNVGVKFRLNP